MISISKEDAKIILRTVDYLTEEGSVWEDELELAERIRVQLAQPAPAPPRAWHQEEDEYEPNVGY